MKIGIGLPSAVPGVEPETLARWALSAEACGFDALGVPDKVVGDGQEPLVTLAAAAAVTEHIELVTDALVAPVRATALLAKQLATLDRLCTGRLTVGLGLGRGAEDFTAVGMFTDGRAGRFDRQLRELRELWRGDRIGPAPTRPGGPPLLVAGSAARSIERAARWADGWCADAGTVAQFRAGSAILGAAWAAHRRTGRPRTLVTLHFALGPDGPAAVRRNLHHYVGPAAGDLAHRAPTEPDTVERRLTAYARAGAQEVLLMPCSPEPEQVDLLAEAVAGWRAARSGADPSAPFLRPTGDRHGRQAAPGHAGGCPDLWAHLL